MRKLLSIAVAAALVTIGWAPGRTQDAARAKTGTIKGKLIWAEEEIPQPRTIDLSKVPDPRCGTKPIIDKKLVIDPKNRGVADGVAYLLNPVGDFTEARKKLIEKTPEVVIHQANCEILPRMTVVHEGQKLRLEAKEFSGHSISAAVFKDGRGRSVHPGMLPPKWEYLAQEIQKAHSYSPAHLVCSVHYWMESDILTSPHPFAVVTGADGSFEIENVPVGEQRLRVWHATKGYVNVGRRDGMLLVVKAGAVTDVGEVKLDN